MTRYISRAKYTPDAFRGLLNNLTERAQAAREFGEGVGAEMLDFYFDFSAGEAISIWQATSEQMRCSGYKHYRAAILLTFISQRS